jgi:uncharacterized protein with von Willebrand factor type A (vWA) domain
MAEAPFTVETIELDLPAVVAAFSRRLHRAGVPMTAERAARFADALKLVRPITRRRLYWTARAVLVSDASQGKSFDNVFFSVFGARRGRDEPEADDMRSVPSSLDQRPGPERNTNPVGAAALGTNAASKAPLSARDEAEDPSREAALPTAASDEELLREKRFDALEPDELAQLYRLMTRLRVATPVRRTRRARRDRHGERIDMRRTLRVSMRTGGDPFRLARRRRRVVRRRIVMLCDISGSMEPYARAYLQFLTSATRSGVGGGRVAGGGSEAFVFATRLTRVTRALRSRSPERAIQRAAAAAPDWSSGTRIGDALKAFNDRHGRRGMARGAVIVILSDGWERGAPALVGREMERLARLAHRIVWVNPRVAASGFVPRAGGMAAALPHCDALVSGHNLRALEEVAAAIGAPRGAPDPPGTSWRTDPRGAHAEEQESWASATPVPGSSVAMPSGYGPSRGRTTPGWSRATNNRRTEE